MSRPCLSLLTDFGLQDSYVGQMKGVIAAVNPDAIVVDLTHQIPAQQIACAAFVLADSIDAFAPATIHVAVVDPGVGSARRAIAAEIGLYRFVCPDNGILTEVLRHRDLRRAVVLDNPKWWRPQASQTFHGRDIFAPVAAAWSLGRDLSELGSPLNDDLQRLELPDCQVERVLDGANDGKVGPCATVLRGQIIAIDHFGNLITNLSRTAIPVNSDDVEVSLCHRSLTGIVQCYADRNAGDCVALFGSGGRLEVAVVNGNAASRFEAKVGDAVIVRHS